MWSILRKIIRVTISPARRYHPDVPKRYTLSPPTANPHNCLLFSPSAPFHCHGHRLRDTHLFHPVPLALDFATLSDASISRNFTSVISFSFCYFILNLFSVFSSSLLPGVSSIRLPTFQARQWDSVYISPVVWRRGMRWKRDDRRNGRWVGPKRLEVAAEDEEKKCYKGD